MDEYISGKQAINYRFWIKASTPWKLSCEANNKNRKQMFDLLIPTKEYDNASNDLLTAKFALQRITRLSMVDGGIQCGLSIFMVVLIACCYKLNTTSDNDGLLRIFLISSTVICIVSVVT